MSFLSTVTSFLQANQTNKSQTLGGSFSLLMKNLWKSSSPTLSRDQAAVDCPKYELVEKEDKEDLHHLQDSEWDDQFENLKLVLLAEEEDEEEDESFEKLKDLSESLDEAEARLDWVVKTNCESSLDLDNLSLTSSITTDSGAQSDSDFLWTEDEDNGCVGSRNIL